MTCLRPPSSSQLFLTWPSLSFSSCLSRRRPCSTFSPLALADCLEGPDFEPPVFSQVAPAVKSDHISRLFVRSAQHNLQWIYVTSHNVMSLPHSGECSFVVAPHKLVLRRQGLQSASQCPPSRVECSLANQSSLEMNPDGLQIGQSASQSFIFPG